jgi:hypothetical protein
MLIGALCLASLGGMAMGAAAVTGATPPQTPFAQHIAQAGIKQCAAAFPALGDILTQGATYAVETAWNPQNPDAHAVQGLVGLSYASQGYQGKAAGIVYAAPSASGCAGQMVRVAPFAQSCADLAKTLPEGTTLAQSLADTPLYNLGDGAGQAMLLSVGQSCVAVSIARLD